MKKVLTEIIFFLVAVMSAHSLFAQRDNIQYFRYYDQRGVNIFETGKQDTIVFDGMKLRIGAGFTQGFQSLSHSNTSGVALYKLSAGFPLAQANFNIDAQLADGVHLNLVTYMSSHHHNEMWVKGGFVQIDKVTFLNSDVMNRIWKDLTLKVGHMEINYGDAHFRRSDGGNTMWNPFIENNIMDAFTTEIGGELYWQKNGFLVMGGITNGEIQGSVTRQQDRGASMYGKLGYDKTFGVRNRLRLTASILNKTSSISGTLYGGDRTGSNYQYVMEPDAATLTGNAFAGRFNPGFKDNVRAIMFNPFIKLGGVEFFGTYEISEGQNSVENGEIQYLSSANETMVFSKLPNRKFTQVAADILYRFGKREQFYIGARYNHLQGTMVMGQGTDNATAGGISQGVRDEIYIERTAFAAGWFITKNILVKGEYVKQGYHSFLPASIYYGGKFNGFVIQGSIGF